MREAYYCLFSWPLVSGCPYESNFGSPANLMTKENLPSLFASGTRKALKSFSVLALHFRAASEKNGQSLAFIKSVDDPVLL
jgi:hypothetical protein